MQKLYCLFFLFAASATPLTKYPDLESESIPDVACYSPVCNMHSRTFEFDNSYDISYLKDLVRRKLKARGNIIIYELNSGFTVDHKKTVHVLYSHTRDSPRAIIGPKTFNDTIDDL